MKFPGLEKLTGLEFLVSKYSFFIGLILTLALLWPLFASPFFSHHDDVQVIRLHQMNKCVHDLQIPCRWVPDLGGLYGYPLFNYYAPLPYYFGEIFYLLSGSYFFSVKVMFAFSFVASYIFMFLLGRRLWGSLGGALSAIFYSYAPYHAVAFYVRGAMGEMWGLMFFPAIIWALLKLYYYPKITNVLLLTLFLAGLITSHNLSTLIFLPFVFILIVVLWIRSIKLKTKSSFRFVKFTALSFALGLLISAFYWLPMVVEKDLVHVESTTSGYFSYTEHFKGLRKLFLERTWGWGASVREVPGGERDGMSFQIGLVHMVGLLLVLISLRKILKNNPDKLPLVAFLIVVTFIGIFMVNPRSEFIWKLIDPLRFVQFPWRFLMLIIFGISSLAGGILLLNPSKKIIIWTILVILTVGCYFSYFRPEKYFQVTEEEFLSGESWDKLIKRSIFDFLPIYASEPPRALATNRYELIVGEGEVTHFYETSRTIDFDIKTSGHTIIRLSQYYFPNWIIEVNGQPVVLEYKNNYLGLMSIIIGAGDHHIHAELQDTTVRSVSNLLTLAGILLTFLLLLTQIPKIRGVVMYYLRNMHR